MSSFRFYFPSLQSMSTCLTVSGLLYSIYSPVECLFILWSVFCFFSSSSVIRLNSLTGLSSYILYCTIQHYTIKVQLLLQNIVLYYTTYHTVLFHPAYNVTLSHNWHFNLSLYLYLCNSCIYLVFLLLLGPEHEVKRYWKCEEPIVFVVIIIFYLAASQFWGLYNSLKWMKICSNVRTAENCKVLQWLGPSVTSGLYI